MKRRLHVLLLPANSFAASVRPPSRPGSEAWFAPVPLPASSWEGAQRGEGGRQVIEAALLSRMRARSWPSSAESVSHCASLRLPASTRLFRPEGGGGGWAHATGPPA